MEKPKLERRARIGQHGEAIVELTPESEAAWSRYLMDRTMAKIALSRAANENED